MLLHPKPSTRLSPSLVAANGGATSHCGEKSGATPGRLSRLPRTHLWKIFHRKPWSAGAFMCGGALYGLWYAILVLCQNEKGKKKIKASNSNRTGPRPPPPPGVKTEWLQSHSLHRQTSTTPTTTFTAWLNFTHRRRGQSFTTSHERNDVIFSSNFEQINAVCKKKKKKKTKRHNTYSY